MYQSSNRRRLTAEESRPLRPLSPDRFVGVVIVVDDEDCPSGVVADVVFSNSSRKDDKALSESEVVSSDSTYSSNKEFHIWIQRFFSSS